MIFWIICGILAFLIVAIFAPLFYCFKQTFYHNKPQVLGENEYSVPTGGIYDNHYDQFIAWAKASRELPHEKVETISFDGLKLRGKYYESQKGAPIEIMFNGYRGNAERDMSGGIERCFKLGRNALIVNQRACGDSEGKVHTFGINEKKDCLAWIKFCIEKFGENCQLILTGISMGGATVLLASRETLPKNVKYVLSDCSYTSAKEIICKTIKEMKLPSKICFPFVKLSGKIFGKFNVEKDNPINAVANATLPIILFHGNQDTLIPCEMAQRLYNACITQKYIYIVDGAEHGLAYPEDKEGYLNAIREFEKQIGFKY